MIMVLKALSGQKSVVGIWREHQVSRSLFYLWREQFLAAGERALSNRAVRDESEALRARVEKEKKHGEPGRVKEISEAVLGIEIEPSEFF